MKQIPSRDKRWEKNGLRIISVILSLLLWFYVVNEGAYQVGQNSVTVDLVYENIQEGIQVHGPEQVKVRLWGVFQETGDIEAYIDLQDREAGVYTVPVKLHPVRGVLFTSLDPKTVNVVLEQMQEVIVPVNYYISGQPPAGYQLIDIFTEPERCLIMGNQEEANKVASVLCQVDLTNSRSINSFEMNVTPRDKEGNPVNGELEIIPATVKVIAVVEEIKGHKEVPIVAVSEGEPAAGYQLKDIILDSNSVKIVGNHLALEAINEINTGNIDINGVDQSFELTIDLQAPQGIKLYPNQVVAQIEIEQIIEDEEGQ